MSEFNDYPAAHSMDTQWYAIDDEGNIAVFNSWEAGAVPVDAYGDEGGDLVEEIAKVFKVEPELDEYGELIKPESIGLFSFEHSEECENWISGPYLKVGTPEEPLKIGRIPASLKEKLSPVHFRGVKFSNTDSLQPVEHFECESWQEAYMNENGEETLFPGKGAHGDSGSSSAGSSGAAEKKPWWKRFFS